MNNGNYFNQPIRNLQTMLQAIGNTDDMYETVVPDGIFGPETLSAVSAFQRAHAIPATGVVNQQTWDAIVSVYENAVTNLTPACPLGIDMKFGTVYRQGDSSPNIHLIQTVLYQFSKYLKCICQTEINGTMDEATCTAVEQFQQICNLPSNGNVDKLTWKYMALFYPLAAAMES